MSAIAYHAAQITNLYRLVDLTKQQGNDTSFMLGLVDYHIGILSRLPLV